jgi:plastocyanin
LILLPGSALRPDESGSYSGPAGAQAGSVAGTVRLASAPAEAPPRLSPYSTPRYRPQAPPLAASTVEDVIIYVASPGTASTAGAAARAPATVNQRNRRIIPRVTAVQVGTEVRFPNEDDVFHNLFSLSNPKKFNLGRYPPGESESVTFDEPGVVRLFCDIHSEMSAVIMVLPTPFFTRPAADGSYQLPNLPAGTHAVVAWHDRATPDTVIVTVADGRVSQADFSLGSVSR